MGRLVAALVVVAAILVVGGFASGLGAAKTRGSTLEARLGDTIRVVDAPIGCRIARMRQLGGRIVVDCRRAGPLTGTYGTLVSAREAVLVRFRSKRTAKQVVVAIHGGATRRCT